MQFITIVLLNYNCYINKVIAILLLLQYINCNTIKQIFIFIYLSYY